MTIMYFHLWLYFNSVDSQTSQVSLSLSPFLSPSLENEQAFCINLIAFHGAFLAV